MFKWFCKKPPTRPEPVASTRAARRKLDLWEAEQVVELDRLRRRQRQLQKKLGFRVGPEGLEALGSTEEDDTYNWCQLHEILYALSEARQRHARQIRDLTLRIDKLEDGSDD